MDLVLGGVPGGEEDDRDFAALGQETAENLDPVDVGQHHVEDQDMGTEVPDGLESAAPRSRRGHLEAGVAQRHRHKLGDVRLVIDHEGPDLALVHASMMAEKPGKFLRIAARAPGLRRGRKSGLPDLRTLSADLG